MVSILRIGDFGGGAAFGGGCSGAFSDCAGGGPRLNLAPSLGLAMSRGDFNSASDGIAVFGAVSCGVSPGFSATCLFARRPLATPPRVFHELTERTFVRKLA